MLKTRHVIIYKDTESSYFIAEVPSLPGCVSQGKNRPEALENIQEAIQAYVEALEMDGLPVPEDNLDAVLIALPV